MSRTGMFVIATARGSLIFLALALITKTPAVLAGAAFTLGMTALVFPREMTSAGDQGYSPWPNGPWAYRVSGVVLVAAAIAIAVAGL